MGLYEKLYKIMDGSKAIDKDMTIQFKASKYSAVSESAVLNEVKALLKEFKVIILPVDVNQTYQERKDKEPITILLVTWKIIDAETGEFELIQSPGHGVDSQDKGSGKAFTYAYKTLMQKCFMLFSGDDTDNTHSDELTAQEQAQAEKLKQAAAKKAAAQAKQAEKPAESVPVDLKPADKARFEVLKNLFNILPEKTKLLTLDGYGISKIDDLPADKWAAAITGLNSWIDRNNAK